MAEITLESLAAQLSEQNKVIEKQNALINDLQATALKSVVEEAKPITIPKEAVEVNGKKYKFNVARFAFPGSHAQYLSEEVVTDTKILKQIIAIKGQGILTELV